MPIAEDTEQIDMDTMKSYKHWHVHIYIILIQFNDGAQLNTLAYSMP